MPIAYMGYFLMPLLIITGYLLGGWYNFITPVFCFVIHPILNLIPPKKKVLNHEPSILYPDYIYRLIIYGYIPVLLATTFFFTYASARSDSVVFIGLFLSTGITNGVIGFTLAHELIHRRNKGQRVAGYLLLLCNSYMHYGVEHIGGHHVYACTAHDPHTARTGESYYRFLPRAILMTFCSAWKIETRRIRRTGASTLILSHRVFLFMLMQLTLIITIILTGNFKTGLFFLSQCFVAICLLHMVNYLQHYGLMRRKTTNGHYERMAAHHSWQSSNRLNSINLFHLENHADHHINPNRSYEKLVQLQDSPQHPTGYSGMIMLALLPPLWFRIINHSSLTNKQINQ